MQNTDASDRCHNDISWSRGWSSVICMRNTNASDRCHNDSGILSSMTVRSVRHLVPRLPHVRTSSAVAVHATASTITHDHAIDSMTNDIGKVGWRLKLDLMASGCSLHGVSEGDLSCNDYLLEFAVALSWWLSKYFSQQGAQDLRVVGKDTTPHIRANKNLCTKFPCGSNNAPELLLDLQAIQLEVARSIQGTVVDACVHVEHGDTADALEANWRLQEAVATRAGATENLDCWAYDASVHGHMCMKV